MDGMQHLYAPSMGLALALVKDTADPQTRGRVQVTLLAASSTGTTLDVWAPCIVPSAGSATGPQYGVALLPKTGEIVLVAFLSPDQPFVIGAVWSGQNSAPSAVAPVEQRYAIVTPYGNNLVFDDSAGTITLSTKGGFSIVLDDTGQTCTATVGTTSIQATTTGVTVTTSSSIQLQTASLTVTAPSVTVNAAMSQFSGAIQCDTLIANTVMGASYTPGAGNIW
jgi:uncharacterized protein involved in type VI secretion and phage assembly